MDSEPSGATEIALSADEISIARALGSRVADIAIRLKTHTGGAQRP
jgi:hypothetical protein